MIEGETRRKEIIETLANADKPVSASKFATRFGVSRQIIVGDIALLRAAGEGIVATARGYLLEDEQDQAGLISKIAVQHQREQTEEELQLIVAHGGEILDVIVEHPLYGELTGMLHIKTEEDIRSFMKRYRKSQASLLSELTDGIHLHTIRYSNEQVLQQIKQGLAEAGILFEENQ
ncbi:MULTISPECIES: transcription repressor NadR [Enterococcus]|uniref:Transcriptional regulator n=1 Tax=Candidatus Enterococcus mangumiae TaxID=2230878 RepID=A0ABZ2T0T3_9ENTE|nr:MULTISPECIES: transcription repressor NadR [unclassified Enterococcus]MBO0460527.1 transcription repressor NadR [Enterococcus sp. DIV1298c]MBO0489162.1 transcription repressor NadR [Enterococcus sp. DIV1094]MBO1298565.1 transcription repressor NadR [Enterococcus sp. DIV1271a]